MSGTRISGLWGWIILVVLVGSVTASGKVIYVDDNASLGGNGQNWATPYRYLQNALGAAVSGDEIRVAQGIYRPDEDSAHPTGTGARTAAFQLKNGVAVKGGYAGFGQPVPDARDPNTHETILSGDLLGNDGPDFANNYENSYNIVTGSGTNETAVLDGFTVTAGNANGDDPHAVGGGIYNWNNSSPTLTNCIFTGNKARKGGGMYNNNSNPTVTNCTFSGNSVYQGGGMYNNDSSPTVTNCTFSGNSSSWTGGGMRNWESSPTVTNCMFSGNSSGWDGGGIQNASNSSSLLVNCMFAGNSAANGGGGMNNWRSSPTVTNCMFSGNSGSGFGGGMFNYESSPTVTNCTFSRNSASRGGGMSNRSSSSATVTNCILWGNSASSGPQIYNDGTSSVTVSYSDVQGGWPSAGNINSNPLFVDQAIGDYHLLTGSPCIDTGDNSAVPPSVVTDLDGNPRIIDGTVDMGAYEGPYNGFLLQMKINKSSRHAKITGDFGESVILYWLSKYGFECALVDHTGIDIIARNPHTNEVMGISVKSRCRNKGAEEESVTIRNSNFDKAKKACAAFECIPYFAIVIDAGNTIRGYILSMDHLLKLFPNGKTASDWKMREKYLEQYSKDPQIKTFVFTTETTHWW